MPHPTVSIIIVSWNCETYLVPCIESIHRETSIPFEIIVVDNASTDNTVSRIKDTFLDVILIQNSKNHGFAAANNHGAKIASGEFLLFLNPDTIILDRAIEKTINFIKQKPEIGCLGCQVWEDEFVIQQTCFKDPGLLNQLLVTTKLGLVLSRIGVSEGPWYESWKRTSDREVDVVSGMYMLIPKNLFELVGEMDESFFVYGEEADLCRRIRQEGYICHFFTGARIIHDEGGSKSTKQVKPIMYRQLRKSHMYYIEKHDGQPAAVFGNLAYLVLEICKAVTSYALYIILKAPRYRLHIERSRSTIPMHFKALASHKRELE